MGYLKGASFAAVSIEKKKVSGSDMYASSISQRKRQVELRRESQSLRVIAAGNISSNSFSARLLLPAGTIAGVAAAASIPA